MKDRLLNFSASSPVIPEEVIERIEKNIIQYRSSGFSALEINYKNPLFLELMEEVRELLRSLLHLDDDMEILFINGGGSMHFAMVPLNFAKKGDTASIINSDLWTDNAVKEARKHVKVDEINLIGHRGVLPKITLKNLDPSSRYLFMCTNNTSSGSRFSKDKLPDIGDVPLIADMTSNLLSEDYDMNRFALSFSSSAKNMGTSGISVVIVKKSMLEPEIDSSVPKILSYRDYFYSGNTFTTPNTFAVYLMYEMLMFVKRMGGVAKMEEINREKANLLYDCVDNSSYYSNSIASEDRSITSVIFSVKNSENFIQKAKENGIINLSTSMDGQVRAGFYNGVSISDVKGLIDFMHKYEKEQN